MRFGFSQKRPAGPQGTRPEAAGLIGVVLGGPASSVPRLRPAAPLAAPPPGFCSVVEGVPSLGEPLAEGRLGSVTVVVSPVELPLLPALLVLEGLVAALLPSLGVFESSLELPHPVSAQSSANTHGNAASAAPGHSRICHLRAERREAPRIPERFIVYSHCALARSTRIPIRWGAVPQPLRVHARIERHVRGKGQATDMRPRQMQRGSRASTAARSEPARGGTRVQPNDAARRGKGHQVWVRAGCGESAALDAAEEGDEHGGYP